MTFRFLALITLAFASTVCNAQDWELDPSFGSQGKVTTSFDLGGNNADRIVKLLRYPDSLGGRYVAVGAVTLAGGGIGIGLARYNADGSPDLSFGGSNTGRRVKDACMTNITNAAFDSLFRIVVVGSTSCSGNSTMDAAVVRFTASGADDVSFAGDGGLALKYRPTPGLDVNDYAGAVLVLPDDSLLVGGGSGTTQSGYIQRVSSAGVPSAGTPARALVGAANSRVIDVVPFGLLGSYWLIKDDDTTSPGTVWRINHTDLSNDTGFGGPGGFGQQLVAIFPSPGLQSCGPESADYTVSSLVRFGSRIVVFGHTQVAPVRSFYVTHRDDGSNYRMGCLDAPGNTAVPYQARAALVSADETSIYLAGARNAARNFAFWRLVKATPLGEDLIPDASFNGGQPVITTFTALAGATPQSDAFSMVRHGRQTVLAGFRVWNPQGSDLDFAIARFGSILFQDGFE